MAIIKAEEVSIRYITGDFKDIGLKEYVVRRLRHNYHVTEFWADRHINFSLEKGDMLGRGVILDDGSYHYCMSVLRSADGTKKSRIVWSDVFGSFGLL